MIGGRGPVLAVDASGTRPCAALLGPDGEPWGEWRQAAGTRGTAQLGVAVGQLLAARGLGTHSLGGLAVGLGPGSYTGLRASIALVRGLAFAAQRPVAGVVSFAAVARAVLRRRPEARGVIVLLDARRGEAQRADYARGPDGVHEIKSPHLLSSVDAGALADDHESCIFVVRDEDPEGYDVAALGRQRLLAGGDAPATLLPLYLKRSHAEIAHDERARRP